MHFTFRFLPALVVIVVPVLLSFINTSTAQQPSATEFSKLDIAALPVKAKIHLGGNPDWLAVGFGSVWVSIPRNNEIVRINPEDNTVQARITVGEEPGYGIGIGTNYVWVLNCKSQTLTRINPRENQVDLTVPANIAMHGEGSIAVTGDSVWYVSNKDGHSRTLVHADDHGRTLSEITVGADSAVVTAGFNSIWVTSSGDAVVQRVDPQSHKITATIKVPATPRFTTIGADSVWVLSQSDGSVSRIDPRTNQVAATIAAKVPGTGGDIAYGEGYIWVAAAGIPMSRINPASNKVLEQFGNYKDADAIRYGFGSVWITDHSKGKGDLWRVDPKQLPDK
jgi:virginiamycin B lyase